MVVLRMSSNYLKKKGPKNKWKNRLIPGEFIQLQDTVLSKPYHKVQIAEIIGDSKIIANIILESGDTEQRTIQLADIAGYIDEPLKKKSKVMWLLYSIKFFWTRKLT